MMALINVSISEFVWGCYSQEHCKFAVQPSNFCYPMCNSVLNWLTAGEQKGNQRNSSSYAQTGSGGSRGGSGGSPLPAPGFKYPMKMK